jgi:hypothetical protein
LIGFLNPKFSYSQSHYQNHSKLFISKKQNFKRLYYKKLDTSGSIDYSEGSHRISYIPFKFKSIYFYIFTKKTGKIMKTFYSFLISAIFFIGCSSDKIESSDLHIIKNYKTLSESVAAGDGSLLIMSYVVRYDKQTDGFLIEVRSVDYIEKLVIENPVYYIGSANIGLKASVPEADDFNDQVFNIFIDRDVFSSIVENGYYISFRVLTPVIGQNTYYINNTVEEKKDLLELYKNIKF